MEKTRESKCVLADQAALIVESGMAAQSPILWDDVNIANSLDIP